MTGEKNKGSRRGALAIMGQLIGLVRPLLPLMCLAIFLGVIGYLCAIFLTIVAAAAMLKGLAALGEGYTAASFLHALSFKQIFILLVGMAVARGLLHYGEQYCNHFIAFKLLALIRHKVFAALRKLCPARLEGKDKGNLVSIITSDIELLEVFYAHTISPIAIAFLISIFMSAFMGSFCRGAALIALAAYGTVGILIPVWVGRKGKDAGMDFRNAFGDLGSFVLDSLRGLDETLQYQGGENRLKALGEASISLGKKQKKLSQLEEIQRAVTNACILFYSLAMLLFMMWQCKEGGADFGDLLICTVSMMGSFGPVVALSNLSNNLNQTLACGERVLSLLEEEPMVEEKTDGLDVAFSGATASHVDFSYREDEEVLKDCSLQVEKGKILGIHGQSGCGKSTLLKLFMRFWDRNSGEISISGADIKEINTASLRNMESYVIQETYLFHDSIANNIAIGRPGASMEEIEAAAQKASIHDFIMTLPRGYETEVGELGDTLSGGEKQRIGMARAFLNDNDFWLLDEPTSNLDALNEGIILRSLKEAARDKTILLVSHRKSTMNLADQICEM